MPSRRYYQSYYCLRLSDDERILIIGKTHREMAKHWFGSTSILTLTTEDVTSMLSHLGNSYSFLRVSVQRAFLQSHLMRNSRKLQALRQKHILNHRNHHCCYNSTGNEPGSLLIISALIIFLLYRVRCLEAFRAVTICSIILSIVAALTGMFISILGGTPVSNDRNGRCNMYSTRPPRQSDC